MLSETEMKSFLEISKLNHYNPLVFAIKTKNVKAFVTLISSEHIEKINEVHDFGKNSLLHLCFEYEFPEIKLLIEAKANINATNDYNETPLHSAAKKLSPDIALLIQNNANVNAIDQEKRTPLMQAIKSFSKKSLFSFETTNNIGALTRTVQTLLSAKADVNIQGEYGQSCLTMALQNKVYNIIPSLAQHGLYVDAPNQFGETPLISACSPLGWSIKDESRDEIESAAVDTVQALLQAKANIHAKNKWGNTALHCAAESHFPKLVSFLIEYKANVGVINEKDENKTPLFSAIPFMESKESADQKDHNEKRRTAHLSVISCLISAKANIHAVDKETQTVLHKAAYYLLSDAILLISKAGADINHIDSHQNTPLMNAISSYHVNFKENNSNQIATVNTLLSLKANANLRNKLGETAISLALENKLMDILPDLLAVTKTELLNAPLADGNTLLTQSLESVFFAREYCKRSVNDRGDKKENLEKKDIEDDLAIIRFLLPHVDINQPNKYGNTSLHIAAEQGALDIVQLLLTATTIDANKVNKTGNTPLMQVIDSYHFNEKPENCARQLLMVNMLLPKTNLNIKNCDQETAVHLSLKRGRVEILGVLLKLKGIDLKCVDKNGSTPLTIAIRSALWTSNFKQITTMVKMLLEASANPDMKDKYEKTAIHIASETLLPDVLSLLLSKKDAVAREQAVNAHCLDSLSNLANGNTPLMLAMENFFDSESDELICYHKRQRYKQVLNILVEDARASVNASNYYRQNALMVASRRGLSYLVPGLIHYGADINARSLNFVNTRTVLMCTITSSRNSIPHTISSIAALVCHGANVYEKDDSQNNLIHLAVDVGFLEIILPLFRLKVPYAAQNSSNKTPFTLAKEKHQTIYSFWDSSDIEKNQRSYLEIMILLQIGESLAKVLSEKKLQQCANNCVKLYLSLPENQIDFTLDNRVKLFQIISQDINTNFNKFFIMNIDAFLQNTIQTLQKENINITIEELQNLIKRVLPYCVLMLKSLVPRWMSCQHEQEFYQVLDFDYNNHVSVPRDCKLNWPKEIMQIILNYALPQFFETTIPSFDLSLIYLKGFIARLNAVDQQTQDVIPARWLVPPQGSFVAISLSVDKETKQNNEQQVVSSNQNPNAPLLFSANLSQASQNNSLSNSANSSQTVMSISNLQSNREEEREPWYIDSPCTIL